MTNDGIILIAKQPGPTSFKCLNSVKKAINSTKVGHTGTLDSFAQGLLVVCTGRLTRLSGNIIEFNKSYKAVIKFGEETDTLEYTGNTIKKGNLPTKEQLEKAIIKYTGTFLQKPPVFSAIHVEGQRASDLMRSGIQTDLPAREVTVFDSKIEEIKTNTEGLVEYALINFDVSKGTYIRSLARDIALECKSCAQLIGLFRTRVGNFTIEEAAGFKSLQPFSIDNAISTMEEQKLLIQKEKEEKKLNKINNEPKQKYIPTQEELSFQEEIRNKKQFFKQDTAQLCGFQIIQMINEQAAIDFENGRSLHSKNFNIKLYDLPANSIIAVFTKDNNFAGLLEKDNENKIHYKLVIN